MTGEMSKSEVTKESYPAFFALRDAINKRYKFKASVEPFDQYQGPYIFIEGFKVWAGQPFQPHGVKNNWVVEYHGETIEVYSGKGVFKELDKVLNRKQKKIRI